MQELIEILEALLEKTMMENKILMDRDRRKDKFSYFEGKVAGIEMALEKARIISRKIQQGKEDQWKG